MLITRKHLISVDSTNLWAKRELLGLEKDTLLILTSDEQTHGKGREGKSWISPKGKNIYISFVFSLNGFSTSPGCFSQLTAVSTHAFLQKFGVTCRIKWPNDLLVRDKKIAGILTEIVSIEQQQVMIIGIGINCSMTKKNTDSFDRPVTSILVETGKIWPLDHLKETFIAVFINNLLFAKKNGFEEFQKQWLSSVAWMLGTPIIHNGQATHIQNINTNGTLTVTGNQGTYMIHSGDVHCF